MDAEGQVLAMERREIEGDRSSRPVMDFEKNLEPATQDLLVACWCAQVFAESRFITNNGNSVRETRNLYLLCCRHTSLEEAFILT